MRSHYRFVKEHATGSTETRYIFFFFTKMIENKNGARRSVSPVRRGFLYFEIEMIFFLKPKKKRKVTSTCAAPHQNCVPK